MNHTGTSSVCSLGNSVQTPFCDVFSALKAATWAAQGSEGAELETRAAYGWASKAFSFSQPSEDAQQASPGGKVLPRLFSSWPLFVSRVPGCDPLGFPRAFASANLLGEKCSYCSVTKHVLEMEKALLKENMTSQWKRNSACWF